MAIFLRAVFGWRAESAGAASGRNLLKSRRGLAFQCFLGGETFLSRLFAA
jgi:hypothetical protein